MITEKQKQTSSSRLQKFLERFLIGTIGVAMLGLFAFVGIFYLAFSGKLGTHYSLNHKALAQYASPTETTQILSNTPTSPITIQTETSTGVQTQISTVIPRNTESAVPTAESINPSITSQSESVPMTPSETLVPVLIQTQPIPGGTAVSALTDRYHLSGQMQLSIQGSSVETVSLTDLNVAVIESKVKTGQITPIIVQALDASGFSNYLNGNVRVLADPTMDSEGTIDSDGNVLLNLWLDIELPGFGTFTGANYQVTGKTISDSIANATLSGNTISTLSDQLYHLIGQVESVSFSAIPVSGTGKLSTHTVLPGESLWSIAEQEYGTGFAYKNLSAYNQTAFPSNENIILQPELSLTDKEVYTGAEQTATQTPSLETQTPTSLTTEAVSATPTAVAAITATPAGASLLGFNVSIDILTWTLIGSGGIVLILLLVLIFRSMRGQAGSQVPEKEIEPSPLMVVPPSEEAKIEEMPKAEEEKVIEKAQEPQIPEVSAQQNIAEPAEAPEPLVQEQPKEKTEFENKPVIPAVPHKEIPPWNPPPQENP